jgi:hypothetical protein
VTQQVSTLDSFVGNESEPSDQVVEDVDNDSIRGARDVRWEGSTKQRRSLGEKRGLSERSEGHGSRRGDCGSSRKHHHALNSSGSERVGYRP